MGKKIKPSDLKRQAETLIREGRMPTFAELADAIASSPAAQELLKMKLRAISSEAKS